MSSTMEDLERLKSIFDEAASATDGLPETIRAKAFEIAVNQLLVGSNKIIPNFTQESSQPFIANQQNFYVRMSNATELELGELKQIYRLHEKGDLEIICRLERGTIAVQQRQLTYLFLAAKQLGQELEWISAKMLANQAHKKGIMDNHLSKNLATEKGLILKSGTKSNTQYCLSEEGLNRAIQTMESIKATTKIIARDNI